MEMTTELNKNEDITNMQYVSMQRTKNSFIISNSILLVILFAVCVQISKKENYGHAIGQTVSAISFFNLVLGIFEIFLRTFNLCVELLHFHTKYSGDMGNVLQTWNLNIPSWIIILLSFGLFMIFHNSATNTIYNVWQLGPIRCVLPFFISIILCKIIGLKDSALNTALAISSMGGVDYGTGMAYSYYYGYLAIILPSDGAYNAGLRHKMEQYEANENVPIPVKKLFILIPESGHIPPDLKEASYNWLEATKSLENEVRDRAGVKRRYYKNTVYKIHPGGDDKNHRPVYVTTEGATPMMTFWEILQHSHPQTAAYREHRQQIIASFYETLQMLLTNDPRCRDACELVFYKDYDDYGKQVNVGEILLQRIRNQAVTSI